MRHVCFTSAIIVLLATAAFSQNEITKIELSPTVGIAIPGSGLKDIADVGFAIGLQFSYFVTPRVAIGAAGIYNSFKEDIPVPTVFDVDITSYELTGHIKLFLSKSQNSAPYFKGFAGVFPLKLSTSSGSISIGQTRRDFGFGGALGFQRIGKGSVGSFVEFAIFDILSEGSSIQYANIRVGISFFVEPFRML